MKSRVGERERGDLGRDRKGSTEVFFWFGLGPSMGI